MYGIYEFDLNFKNVDKIYQDSEWFRDFVDFYEDEEYTKEELWDMFLERNLFEDGVNEIEEDVTIVRFYNEDKDTVYGFKANLPWEMTEKEKSLKVGDVDNILWKIFKDFVDMSEEDFKMKVRYIW